MKIRIFITFAFLFAVQISFAQTYPAKHDSTFTFYAEAGIGIAFPQNDFKYYQNSTNEGYATRGICINLNAKAYQNKIFGFILALNGIVNPADDSFYSRASGSSEVIRADVGMWKNISFGVGPLLYLANEGFNIEIGFPVGFLATNRPEILVYNYYPSTGAINRLYTYTGGHSIGFSFSPEISAIINLNDKSQLKFFINYLIGYANVNYQLVFEPQPGSTSTVSTASDLNQKIKVNSMNAGISFVFKLVK